MSASAAETWKFVCKDKVSTEVFNDKYNAAQLNKIMFLFNI